MIMVKLLLGSRLREILTPTLLLLGPLVEVASFPKLLLIVFWDIRVLYTDLSVVLCLVDSLLSVYRWETNVLRLRVKSEERDVPVTFLVIPLRSLMQLVKLIL